MANSSSAYESAVAFFEKLNTLPEVSSELERNPHAIAQFDIGDERFHIKFEKGRLRTLKGANPHSKIIMETDPITLGKILSGEENIIDVWMNTELLLFHGRRDRYLIAWLIRLGLGERQFVPGLSIRAI